MKDKVTKITKSLFKFPLQERVGGYIHDIGCRTEVMHVDKVGFTLYYTKKEQITDLDWIRKCLMMRRNTYALIEADCFEDAVHKFYNEWYGAKIGGDGEMEKAVWINREKTIYELPPCDMYRSRANQGDIICGNPDEWGYAGCIFCDFDAPDDCPGDIFYEKIGSVYDDKTKKWVEPYQPELITVEGKEFKLLSYKTIGM